MAQQNDTGFTIANLMVVALLGFFAWSPPALETPRPSIDLSTAQALKKDSELPARLWQDPFHGIKEHAKTVNTQKPREQLSSPTGADLPSEVKEFLTEDECVPIEKRELIVLLAPLPPGFYPGREEMRRRTRYAILSALGDAHFVPRKTDTLGRYRRRSEETWTWEEPDLDVLYEWYDRETDNDQKTEGQNVVLVLWIDESWLGTEPFKRIFALISDIHKDSKGMSGSTCSKPDSDRCNGSEAQGTEESIVQSRWVMLGPMGSGTLREMVRDQNENDPAIESIRSKSGLKAFDIVSPSATVDDCDLNSKLGCCSVKEEKKKECIESGKQESLLGSGFTELNNKKSSKNKTALHFLRTIKSDKTLISELVSELVDRRGLDSKASVAVISEWDTYFGRSLPRALRSELISQLDIDIDIEKSELKVLRYTYERGIDGLAEKQDGSRKASNGRSEKGDAPNGAIRRPVGTSQLDYLRRLSQKIRHDNEKLRLKNGQGIRAVAVLGSDVYDKLLILQALRSALPSALWITTDLDANLIHPDEFSWTHNLIVASTYDLTIPSKLESSSPPFRDSYQTSTWLATRLAIDPNFLNDKLGAQLNSQDKETGLNQAILNEALPPLLFEVGRDGFVRLQSDRVISKFCLTCEEPRQRWGYAMGALILSAIGILMVHQMLRGSGLIVVRLGAFVLVASLLTIAAMLTEAGGEPLSLRSGVSIWPSIAIRVFTILLTMTFIRKVLKQLKRSACEINHYRFDGPALAPEEPFYLGQIPERVQRLASLRPWLPNRGLLPVWATRSLALLIVLVIMMTSIRFFQFPTLYQLIVQTLLFALIGRVWWKLLDTSSYEGSGVRSINQWMSESSVSTTGTWHSYLQAGQTGHRVLRAASGALIYFALGSTLFSLLGGTGSLGRGQFVLILNGITTGLSVLLMIFLLFLVFDAIRLCIGLVEKLQDSNIDLNEKAIRKIAAEHGLPIPHATRWLQIVLIADRTREVGRLLYYPLLVILLMLLARSTYFDGFDFPFALILIIGMNFSITLVAAAWLNRVALGARERILTNLRSQSLEEKKKFLPEVTEPTLDEIENLIKQLEKLDLGAFQRVWDQPLVRAAIMLLTALGFTYMD